MKNSHKLTIIFVLFSIIQINGQSKKKQIITLKKSLDSVNQSLNNVKELTVQLENQKSEIQARLEKKEAQLISTNNSLINSNKKIKELSDELNKLKDSITNFKNFIKKIESKRDFSNANFNDDELKYIISFFENEISKSSENNQKTIVVNDTVGITVQIEGELGYVPAIFLERNFNKSLAGDIDKDGTYEILFAVEVTGGGTEYWSELYCLKIFPNNNYLLIRMEVPCACSGIDSGNYDCKEPNTTIINVIDNRLTIESRCFLESDANCCPSTKIISEYKFQNNEIILISNN